MGQEIYQVDAFTATPFKGNPAAVCILPRAGDEGWMQNLATEMNLSETAFLVQQDDGYNLRWFTPAVEVDLCGHATLASAHILWETGLLAEDQEARFFTHSGLLTAERRGDWIQLDFPSEPESVSEAPDNLGEALGASATYVGKNRFDYLVEVESEDLVRNLTPDFQLLSSISSRGFMVTSRSEANEFDFISRFFAPAFGINEDPVTGSAHCCLGPYWAKKLDKTELTAYQASPRGGIVRVRVSPERVYLLGKAVTVMRGELY
ncbi:MAG: PhzF family phenazine biosynthesis protein [Deltaproteobacteria bacterium]|jgi:PhzF family phenazine biosynthesis protein|nr:PhzF family phenazine biosynthesis protein [Deltaproteobacteria bacterium]